MYKLEILPIAKRDMDNIIYYVANCLNNKRAANKLSKAFIKGIDNILIFPYGSSEYKPISKLCNPYRCTKVKNFIIFYIVNTENNLIIITRVAYEKMNFIHLLK